MRWVQRGMSQSGFYNALNGVNQVREAADRKATLPSEARAQQASAAFAALFGPRPHGWIAVLVAQPAPWTVPPAFTVMIVVSRFGRPPSWSRAAMLRLHREAAQP